MQYVKKLVCCDCRNINKNERIYDMIMRSFLWIQDIQEFSGEVAIVSASIVEIMKRCEIQKLTIHCALLLFLRMHK